MEILDFLGHLFKIEVLNFIFGSAVSSEDPGEGELLKGMGKAFYEFKIGMLSIGFDTVPHVVDDSAPKRGMRSSSFRSLASAATRSRRWVTAPPT